MKKTAHQVRMRLDAFEEAEKRAIKLTKESGKYIKPTDVIYAAVKLKSQKVTVKDLEDQKMIK